MLLHHSLQPEKEVKILCFSLFKTVVIKVFLYMISYMKSCCWNVYVKVEAQLKEIKESVSDWCQSVFV